MSKGWLGNFWAKVIMTESCWLWNGCVESSKNHSHRYGKVWFQKKLQNSHRVAWILINGPIPKGLFVCHKCDVPLCVNPKHLYLGTPKDNTHDKNDKNRWKSIRSKRVEFA